MTKMGQYLKIPLSVLGTLWFVFASIIGMVYHYGVAQAELNKEVIHLSKKVALIEQRLIDSPITRVKNICE